MVTLDFGVDVALAEVDHNFAWSAGGDAAVCLLCGRASLHTPDPGGEASLARDSCDCGRAARDAAWYGKERRQTWTTPRAIFDGLHAEWGFTMDGAASEENALLPRASTLEAPRSWAGERVFCNPPWSNIPPFIEQAAEAEIAVLLVPARTNARWFHRALDLGAEARFFLGRPRFGGAKASSPVDCLLLVFQAGGRK